MAVSGRELQILRGEYAEVAKDLKIYDALQQQFGQYESQLESSGEIHENLQTLQLEIQQIEDDLAQKNYAEDLQLELASLIQDLDNLQYDDQSHALARAEVERWRWAEIKQVKLDEAHRRQGNINQERPILLADIAKFKQESQQLRQNSELQQMVDNVFLVGIVLPIVKWELMLELMHRTVKTLFAHLVLVVVFVHQFVLVEF
jgi:exonuclease SbcC